MSRSYPMTCEQSLIHASDTDFTELGAAQGTWNVVSFLIKNSRTIIELQTNFQVRSQFDNVLFEHAEASGVETFQQTKVTSIKFSGSRPTEAEYTQANGSSGTIKFDYLIDASGRNGIMSIKYLKNRQINNSLKNIAYWGYWKNGGIYKPGTNRHNAPLFQALTGERTFYTYHH